MSVRWKCNSLECTGISVLVGSRLAVMSSMCTTLIALLILAGSTLSAASVLGLLALCRTSRRLACCLLPSPSAHARFTSLSRVLGNFSGRACRWILSLPPPLMCKLSRSPALLSLPSHLPGSPSCLKCKRFLHLRLDCKRFSQSNTEFLKFPDPYSSKTSHELTLPVFRSLLPESLSR